MDIVRTRFAPSPTGYLHIGGLRTALYAFLFAKQNNGKFVLRIEDTDTERLVADSVEIIYRTLKDSGLVYDEGPDVGGSYAPYIQSERKNTYLGYAQELVDKGAAYYCFCTKDRLEQIRTDGATKYDKHCLSLSKEEIAARVAAGEPYVIRQNIPLDGETSYDDMVYGTITVENKELEDNILIKSDGMPTYNFANVIDDHLMNITYVIRGIEYLSSTPKYNLLYDGFGWERPHYMHLPPIMKDSTRKLSKRYGDASYEDFIKKGYLKEAIINYIALLGWSPKSNDEKMSLAQMIEMFSVDGLSKSSAIFDETKMRWLNSLYIKELGEEEFYRMAEPWLMSSAAAPYDLKFTAKLLQGRIEIFSQIPEHVAFLDAWDGFDLELFVHAKQKTDRAVAAALLPHAIEAVDLNTDVTNLFEELTQVSIALGVKKTQMFWVMRIALTGASTTPGGATDMVALLGKEESSRRMRGAFDRLR